MREIDWKTLDTDKLECGDYLPLSTGYEKIVAMMGAVNDWAAYRGPMAWSYEEVARHGDKLGKDEAEDWFDVLVEAGFRYRP